MMRGDMGTMMSMPLLPSWLRLVWAAALCAVLVLHLVHAWAMTGQRRWWHAGHTLMAAGMTLMYLLPAMTHRPLYTAGTVLFAALTVTLAGATAAFRHREGVLNPLWVTSAADMLVMGYMMLPATARPGWLTSVLVGYLTIQVVVWALGLWDRAPAFRSPAPAVLDVPANTSGAGGVATMTAHSAPTVRISLAVMAASMAYMLVAM